MEKMTEEQAVNVLKKIEDPEIMMDIYALGLIYNLAIDEKNHIDVTMTLTSPACPYGPLIIEQVKLGLEHIGFVEPDVTVTFDPPWEPSDEVQMALGLL
jgi:metal-sulfur cluster biosynthetic enzyme